MTLEELNAQLYRKLDNESKEFIGSLKSSTAELVNKEDIVNSLECDDIEPKQCKVLLKEKKALQEIFEAWEKNESSHMNEIRDVITSHADSLIKLMNHSREQSR